MHYRIITVNDAEQGQKPDFFQTPKYLFEMGMCLCNSCGKLHSIDYAFCNDCFQEIFIDVVQCEKPDDAKINAVINKHRYKNK